MLPNNDPIYHLYFAIADQLVDVDAKHPQAKLYLSEIVLLGMLFVLRGRSFRNFYRWICKQSLLDLPERTRLQRLIIAKQKYTDAFLASETFFNVTDSFGVEVIHPIREKRSDQSKQVSKKGKSNHRWIVGRKINVVLNSRCEVVSYQDDTDNVCDNVFDDAIASSMAIVLSDGNYRKKDNQTPACLKIVKRGEWNERMIVETFFSLWTRCLNMKHSFHRSVFGFKAKVAYLCTLSNLILKLNDHFGFNHLSMIFWEL